MSTETRVAPPCPGEPCKLVSAFIPDDGTDLVLMKALRKDKGVVSANSISCQSMSILAKAKTKRGTLPEPSLTRVVEILVAEADAEQVFEYVCQHANINHIGGGLVMLSPVPFCTPYSLPAGVPEEKV